MSKTSPSPPAGRAKPGSGHLFQRKLPNGTRGRVWWMKYYVHGRPRCESTGTKNEIQARRVLQQRLAAVAKGEPVLPRVDRIKYDEVAQDLRDYYAANGDRSLAEGECRLAHLDRFFRGRRIATLTAADVTRYVLKRQAGKAANGTINRELAVLNRMLRLAYENKKLTRLPVLRKLKEAAPRQGFFERDQYEAVRRHLPGDLQVALGIAYAFGWRMQSEILMLERRHLDLEAGTLRLDPGTTKNADGRVVYLPADLKAELAAQVERVRAQERRLGRIIPFLFPHLRGRYVGQQIRDFRRAWATACKAAGVPGMLRHDCRRTAVRNMVNAGIPERVAMTITGHRTRAVFDRYHIVSPGDLQEAARKMVGYTFGVHSGVPVDSRPVSV